MSSHTLRLLKSGPPVAPEPAESIPGDAPAETGRRPRVRPVLLASDGRARSNAPIATAGSVARRLGVPLHVVMIVDPDAPASPERGVEAHTPDPDAIAHAEFVVRSRVRSVLGAGAPDGLACRSGDIAAEIAAEARRVNACLIVIGGVSDRTRVRAVAGERAAELLRLAPCPVLAVHPDLDGLPSEAVAGIDFSAASIVAVRAGVSALREGAALRLLHVDRKPLAGRERVEAERRRSALFARLADDLRASARPGLRIETSCIAGPVTGSLFAAAPPAASGVLLIGTHGAGIGAKPRVGSVAEHALHHAGCSVLVSPPPRPAEAFRVLLELSGSATSTTKGDWPRILDDFTKRNLGRHVTIEVDDPALGAQVQASGVCFLGASYDVHAGRVEVMVGDAGLATGHLTRGIAGVEAIAACVAADGRDAALEIRHGRSHVLVILDA